MSKMYENWLATSGMKNEIYEKFNKADLITDFADRKSIQVRLSVKTKNALYTVYYVHKLINAVLYEFTVDRKV